VGYRQVPLSLRSGLAFGEGSHWRVDMRDGECFMYFIAQMQRLFGRGHVLYVEGRSIDSEVEALYVREAEPEPRAMAPMDRHSRCRRFHVAMGAGLSRPLNLLAARRTYAQICDSLSVYDAHARVLLDGSRVGERIVRLSGAVNEAALRRFAGGYLRGRVEWVEE
jgi:hypothetical protein